jgi:glycerophosphoryl diester phosphodiesterase
MSFRLFSLSILLAGAVVLPSRGALLLSEVCFNEVSSDVTGEWIEIFNTGPATIDLTNYKIGDEETSGGTGTTEAMHQFPAGASIAPGAVQIVAVNATTFFNHYGILPTYEATSNDGSVPDMLPYVAWDPDGVAFNMANTNDQAIILDGTDTIIDAASWGSSTFAFNPAIGSALDGQSYERINAFIDTDTAADWQAVPGDTAAQRSTPGTVPIPEPTTVSLIIGCAVFLGSVRRPMRHR